MNRFKQTAIYALMHAALWSTYAVLLSFSSNFLYAQNFSGSQISLVLGLATAASVILQLTVAERISRSRAGLLFLVPLAAGAVMLLSCGAMFTPTVGLAVGGFAAACCLLQILPGMVNSLGMSAIEKGAPVNYSIARGIGSLAYSAVSFLAGLLVAKHGHLMVPALTAVTVTALLAAVALFHFQVEGKLATGGAETAQEPVKQGSFLRRHKAFVVFLVGSALLYFNHNLICNFMLQIMQGKGGGAGEQGTANAIGALLELPAMFAFTWLLHVAGCDKWVRLSCAFFVLKAVAIYLAPTPQWVYLAQGFQMVGFALYSISSVNFVGALVGRGETIRAQSYLAATTALGSLAAMSTGGVICQYLGAQTMLLVAAASALLGMAFVMAAARQGKKA